MTPSEGSDEARSVPLAPPSPERGGAGGGVLGAARDPRPVFSRKPHHTAAARAQRKTPTPAERRLWACLRGEALGLSFRRQHPVLGFVVDFYAPSLNLAVELDDGAPGDAGARDAIRTGVLLRHGVTVLRFWNGEVMDDLLDVRAAIGTVARVLAPRTPTLTLPLAGGGDAHGEVVLSQLRLTFGEVG